MTRSLRTLAALLAWLFALALVLLAWHQRDPHLLALRGWLAPALLLSAVAGGALALRGRRYRLAALLIAASLVLLWGEGQFHYRRYRVLDHLPGAAEVGRHFVVGYTDPAQLRPLAARGLIGGIFVTRRNAQGKSREALRAEIEELQGLRREAGLPPLLVSADQEGGVVSRLSPPLPPQPPLASVVEGPREGLAARAAAYGARQGAELRSLGVNINFSPVVDLKPAGERDALDLHTRIDQRAIDADPHLTAEVALAYSRALRAQGVVPTLKHFPGLGRLREDTHHFSATLAVPHATLESSDWLPFREVLAHTPALLMLGHVTLPEFDAELPASLSAPVVEGLIRGEWRHQGALVTDDLTMAAAYRHGMREAAVAALSAGVDLLLVSFDYEHYYEAIYCAATALNEGRLDPARLERSGARLERLLRELP